MPRCGKTLGGGVSLFGQLRLEPRARQPEISCLLSPARSSILRWNPQGASLMRIQALMVIRDEDDIILESLAQLLTWVDAIYILDTGSTDATWEIVNEAASDDKRVVPFKSRAYLFDDRIRGYIFNTFRSRFDDGDWIVRADADEIYHVDPRTFLTERVQNHEGCVYLAWYYFRRTTREVDDYETGKVSLTEDRRRPITERRRYYKIPSYAEPR